MNTYMLSLAVFFYALSCVPMLTASFMDDDREKVMLLFADAILTIFAYIALWQAMSSTWNSIAALCCVFTVSTIIGSICRRVGYDPYGIEARRRNRAARI